MSRILVTGAKGQLGCSIRETVTDQGLLGYDFVDLEELDIGNKTQVEEIFGANHYDFCINCAAYTAVDRAEEERDLAYYVNTTGPKLLAEACTKYGTVLIHISTDFVFGGDSAVPYVETDQPKPVNFYGKTKYLGELEIAQLCSKYFIIRTSWLYSRHGHNFLTTMMRLGKQRKEIQVVEDQIGCPTYAGDLVSFIMEVIYGEIKQYGIYHFSNKGQASWFLFASKIFSTLDSDVKVVPIPSSAYQTVAKRPVYSVLDTSKCERVFQHEMKEWPRSLKDCLHKQ